MPPVGFEPTNSAGERPKTYALDRAVTGTGHIWKILNKIQSTTEFKISQFSDSTQGVRDAPSYR